MIKGTIYLETCNKVVGFQAMGEEFIRKLVINNKARSTHENYLCQIRWSSTRGAITLRTAISNDRIIDVGNETVTFTWKDYKHNYLKQVTTLKRATAF